MQVGSLVELVDNDWDEEAKQDLEYYGVKFPIKSVVYTVREIDTLEPVTIGLEELVNPRFNFTDGFYEPLFLMTRFRELLPPKQISIENILEKVI